MKLREVKYIVEWDDDADDDLSPAERALIAKADKDLAKKGVKVKNFDPDKMVGTDKRGGDEDESSSKPDSKKANTKPTTKQEAKPTSTEDKKAAEKSSESKEGSAAEAKAKKMHAARKFMQDNPNATRKEFTQFMANHGMGAAYANTAFYAMKKKLHEVFYITNEKDQVLAEGDVWTVYEDFTKRLQMFKSEWKAHSKALKAGGKVKKTSV